MTDDPSNSDQRLVALESRLDRFEGEVREQVATLFDGLVVLSQQTTTLANRVDRLAENQQATQTLVTQLANLTTQLAQNAERDRAVWQAEIQRIWEYLLGQSGNGRG